MKAKFFYLFLALNLLINASAFTFTRTTGEISSVDIPVGYCLGHGKIMLNCVYSGGSKEPVLEDNYSVYSFRLGLGIFNFLEFGLNFFTGYDDLFTGYLHLQILKEREGKIVPALAIGIQNIYTEKHISPEGEVPEFDHYYAWKVNGKSYTWEDDQTENNSIYIVMSKILYQKLNDVPLRITNREQRLSAKDSACAGKPHTDRLASAEATNNDLIFHFGLGNSRFVGHSGWSKVQSFKHKHIAFFWGFSFSFKLRERFTNYVILCLDGDGRDSNFSVTYAMPYKKSTHHLSFGMIKGEHVFQKTPHKPKAFISYSLTL